MCWIGVLWPQAIWSRVRPKTAAILSRSLGLGVQRPRTMAAVRPSSRPERAASSLASSLCSRQRSLTCFCCSMARPSRAAAELWAVPLDVDDFVAVAPGDVVWRDTEGCGQPLPLLRAGRPAGLDDGFNDAAL